MCAKKVKSFSTQTRADYFSGGRLGGEEGTVFKDWGGRYPFALIYPNSYFVGMSNLGIQCIYGLLNGRNDIVCERVFWENDGASFLSLESSRPMMDFASLAFSFSYELDYLNLPSILKASGVPLYSKERDESHPFIIAGGPCITANPTPVLPFMDILCVGEAEVILPALIPILASDDTRSEKLKLLSGVPGVWAPDHGDEHKIRRQWQPKLAGSPVHSTVLTHDTELGELFMIEVERGCSGRCNFCLVSCAFSPLRFHPLDSLLAQARDGLRFRKRIGLVGPVVTDHPQIEKLLSGLLDMGAGFSLSSLRLKKLSTEVLDLMLEGGTHSLSLAPEAGSERLRTAIRKDYREEDIMESVSKVAERSFKQLKLYFMIGLPTETDNDIEGIIDLALKSQALLDQGQKGCRLTLNLAPFVPKAGTSFQRMGMADLPTLERRINRLKDSLRGEGIDVKSESPEWSQIQAALSRGGEDMAQVLAEMEKVSLAAWRRAVKGAVGHVEHYIVEDWGQEEKLPWSSIEL